MILVNKKDLAEAIKVVKTSVARQALNPILSTIKIKVKDNKLRLTSTDLCGSAQSSCEVKADGNDKFCINAVTLDNIINKLDDEICIEKKDEHIHIKSNNTLYKVAYTSTDEFPEITFDIQENGFTISKDDFIDAINKSIISTSNIENSILNGVCFNFTKDNFELGATDGTRLSQIVKDFSGNTIDKKFVVPKKILGDITRCLHDEIKISINDDNNSVIFSSNGNYFKQNLLQGTFPDYARLIPTKFKNVVAIKRKELLTSLEKVMVMSDEKSYVTVFNFKDNLCYLNTSCEYGQAEDFIECDYSGELKIAFNYRNIYEGLKVMDEDIIAFCINDQQSACLIKGGFTYLCMPIRIRENEVSAS